MLSSIPPSSPPLSNWFVVSLRPVGQHRRLLRAAKALGADGLSLPGLRLTAREDTPTRVALDDALRCSRVIFTSPAAARYAVRLRMLASEAQSARIRQIVALGQTTRAALRRAGIAEVLIPPHATSESLLALPEFGSVAGARIGLVTAPDGRGLLAQRLREAGATLAIADVYARAPARLNATHARRLLEARGHGAVCITSAEALRNVLAALPKAAGEMLVHCVAVVSSARLDAITRDAGFLNVIRAEGPTPRSLLKALCAHASQQGFR
jgi:uroporphyrinogen-III synthase